VSATTALVLVVGVCGVTVVAVCGFAARAVVEIFRIRKGEPGRRA
jgi:hypothetical protein